MADGISITDLEQKAEVTDNDNFAVDTGAITNKVTAKQIKEYMAPTYVKKEGDTMTGPLHVPTPSSDTRDTSVPTTGWVQDKMDGKAATDLSNGTKATQESINNIMPNTMDYVVESYRNTNGSWWRKWKSGWIEQGGLTTVSNGTSQNFLKPFTNLNSIGFLATTQYSGGDAGDASASVCGRPLSTTTFALNWAWRNYGSATRKWAWYACGY